MEKTKLQIKFPNLKCPKCKKQLTEEHLKLIKDAMAVLMSPVGRFLECTENSFYCEKCFYEE